MNSTSCAPRRCSRRPWSTVAPAPSRVNASAPDLLGKTVACGLRLRESLLTCSIAVDGWVWPITLPQLGPVPRAGRLAACAAFRPVGRASGGLQAAAVRAARRNAASGCRPATPARPACSGPGAARRRQPVRPDLTADHFDRPRRRFGVAAAPAGALGSASRAPAGHPAAFRNHLPLARLDCAPRSCSATCTSEPPRHRGRPARSQRQESGATPSRAAGRHTRDLSPPRPAPAPSRTDGRRPAIPLAIWALGMVV